MLAAAVRVGPAVPADPYHAQSIQGAALSPARTPGG